MNELNPLIEGITRLANHDTKGNKRRVYMHPLAQEIIDGQFVACPHCDCLLDLAGELGILVNAPNTPALDFCSWKCLASWIKGVYETGRQFEYGLEGKGEEHAT